MNQKGQSRHAARFLKLSYLRRHLWPIAIASLCLIYATVEFWEAFGELKNKYHDERQNYDVSTLVGQLNSQVKQTVQNLEGKDAGSLAGEYGWFLENRNCPFVVHCVSVDALPGDSTLQRRMQNLATPKIRPALFLPNSPIPIPTWHTITGTPAALLYTLRQIANAGYWAIAMFLSCAVLWFALMLKMARGETPFVAYLMLVGSPLGIGLMVTLAQCLCEAALSTIGAVGCAIAVSFMAVVHGTALAILVGTHHILKGPRELAEGIEKLKAI